jgi:hypothetical protein
MLPGVWAGLRNHQIWPDGQMAVGQKTNTVKAILRFEKTGLKP